MRFYFIQIKNICLSITHLLNLGIDIYFPIFVIALSFISIEANNTYIRINNRTNIFFILPIYLLFRIWTNSKIKKILINLLTPKFSKFIYNILFILFLFKNLLNDIYKLLIMLIIFFTNSCFFSY